jgi:hypothetical protein
LGKFWRALKREMLVYLMAVWKFSVNLAYLLSPILVYYTKKNLATLDCTGPCKSPMYRMDLPTSGPQL